MALMIGDEAVPLNTDADGTMRVGRSSVTLEMLVSAVRAGVPAEEILRRHPSLDPPDAYAVIGYCLRYRTLVDNYLRMHSGPACEEDVVQDLRGMLSPHDGHRLGSEGEPHDSVQGVEFDLFVRMPPVREHAARLRIESCGKAAVQVVEPGDADAP